MTDVPQDFDSGHWLTPKEAAARFRRTPRSILNWCMSGKFERYGYQVYRDPAGHWWIRVVIGDRMRARA